jgi:hypothetical protein
MDGLGIRKCDRRVEMTDGLEEWIMERRYLRRADCKDAIEGWKERGY